MREEKDSFAQAASLRVRRTPAPAVIAAAAVLLLAAGPQRADAKAKAKHAKVTKSPKGLKFYKPPKKLPKRHGTLIWARKATGLVSLAEARYTKLVLYSSRTPQGREERPLGLGERAKGQATEGMSSAGSRPLTWSALAPT